MSINRLDRVNALLLREIADDLYRVLQSEPEIDIAGITVTKVCCAPNLRTADVWVSIMDAEQHPNWLRKLSKRPSDQSDQLLVAPHAVFVQEHLHHQVPRVEPRRSRHLLKQRLRREFVAQLRQRRDAFHQHFHRLRRVHLDQLEQQLAHVIAVRHALLQLQPLLQQQLVRRVEPRRRLEHRVRVEEVAVVLLPALQLHPRGEALAGRREKQLRAARRTLAGREGGGALREGGLLGEELAGRSVERVPKLLVVRPLEKGEEKVRRRRQRAERALKQRRFLKKRRGVGNRR